MTWPRSRKRRTNGGSRLTGDSHAVNILAALKQAEEDAREIGADDIASGLQDRITELEDADAAHEGVPVSINGEFRGGSVLGIEYLDGYRRGDVVLVDAEELEEWDPDLDRDGDGGDGDRDE